MAIAIFSTWTTYGTWLPGDVRGWFRDRFGLQPPDIAKELRAMMEMTEEAVTLDEAKRHVVERTIDDHCTIRNWQLHAVNCRSNHVRVVVTAPDRAIELPREQFKAWCTRRLNEQHRQLGSAPRVNWWTERGWDEYIDDEVSLRNAVRYVLDGQDRPRH